MPRDGSGSYVLPDDVNPVVNGTTITSTWANSTLEDIEAAITDSLPRNGEGAMTGPLDFGGYKSVRMADGEADSDGATKKQVNAVISSLASLVVNAGGWLVGKIPVLLGAIENFADVDPLPASVADRKIFIRGFYPGSNEGGGWFEYNSSRSAVNNGVECFDGLQRYKNNNSWSLFDAGCKAEVGFDNTTRIQAFFDYFTNIKGAELVIPEGGAPFEITQTIIPHLPNGATIRFRNWIKIAAQTSIGGAFSFQGCRDVMIHNVLIDANDQPEQNGFGVGDKYNSGDGTWINSKTVHFFGGHIKNCKTSDGTGLGGRAMAPQLGCEDIKFFGVTAENCFQGMHAHGRYDGAGSGSLAPGKAAMIQWHGCTFIDCDTLLGVVSFGDSPPQEFKDLSVYVGNFVAYNCGINNSHSWRGTDANPILAFIDSGNVMVSGGYIHNDSSYGKVGSILGGKGTNITVTDLVVEGEFGAIVDGNTWRETDTGDSATSLSSVIVDGIKVLDSVDYVILSEASSAKMDSITVRAWVGAVNTAIADSNTVGKTAVHVDIRQISDGKVRRGSVAQLNAYDELDFSSTVQFVDMSGVNFRLGVFDVASSGGGIAVGNIYGDPLPVFVRYGNSTHLTVTSTGVTIPMTWNGAHLILGTSHFWIYDNKVRCKRTAPTSASDGNDVITIPV